MPEEFQQTVDLKLKKEEKKTRKISPASQSAINNARGIDQVFQDGKKDNVGNLKKIEKYQEPHLNPNLIRAIVMVLMLAVIGLGVYFVFFRNKNNQKITSNWYAVKLINGEEYYGEIADTKADPVVIKNVYYNYDQMKDGVVNKDYVPDANQNIRLVKRGKEAHGPDGSLDVVRAQVVYMEPLKADSKVLKAILNYEKK